MRLPYTKIYDGADISGATPNLAYIPILADGKLREVIVKTDQIVSGADAEIRGTKNGDNLASLNVTIPIGEKLGESTGLNVTLNKGDEIIFELYSGALSSPISFTLVYDDDATGGGMPSGGTTGQVLAKQSNTNYETVWKNALVNIQEFPASGTWTKPTDAKRVYVFLIAGGGPGSSGRKGASGALIRGGNGGNGGAVAEYEFDANDLSATETVTVAGTTPGGTSVTANSTNGNNGADGGDTSFGTKLVARGGKSGKYGASIDAASVGFPTPTYTGGIGASNTSSTNNATDAPNNVFAPTGGGAGGNVRSDPTLRLAPSDGGDIGSATASGLNQIIQGGITNNNANGSNGATTSQKCGTGGGGGWGAGSGQGNAWNGGNGGSYGGGGGGGGASVNDIGNSGAGGSGAPGYALIITYF